MNKDLYKKAQRGLELIENSIKDLLSYKIEGLSNSEIARALGLESSHENKQKDYLTYSVIGNLMEKGIIKKVKEGRKVRYILNE